jgi:hypothetical protein
MKLPVLPRKELLCKELQTSPVSAFALAGFFIQGIGKRGTEGATWQTT